MNFRPLAEEERGYSFRPPIGEVTPSLFQQGEREPLAFRPSIERPPAEGPGALSVGIGTGLESAIESASFGVWAPDIVPEETEKKHPTAAAIGHVAGDVAGTIGSFMVIGGGLRTISITKGLMASAMQTARTGSTFRRIIAGTKMSGSVGGLDSILRETVKQVKEKDPNIPRLASEALEGAVGLGLLGGFGAGAQASPRIVRALAGGTALSSSTAMIRIAKGEEPSAEELVSSFLTGAAFEFILSKKREIGVKESVIINDMADEFHLMATTKMSKKQKIEWYKKFEKRVSVFGEGEETKSFIDTIKGVIDKYQGEIGANPAWKNLPPGTKKSISSHRATITSLFRKEIPETSRFKARKVGGKKLIKESPAERKLVEELTENIFGKKFTTDLSIPEMKYYIKELKHYINLQKLPEYRLDGKVEAPTWFQTHFTPVSKTFFEMNAGSLMLPTLTRERHMAIEVKRLNQFMNFQRKAFIQASGLGRKEGEAALHKAIHRGTIEGLNKEQLSALSHFRDGYDYLLQMTNSYYAFIGKPPVKRISDYGRRVYNTITGAQAEEQQFGGVKGLYGAKKLPEDIKNVSAMIRKRLTVPEGELTKDVVKEFMNYATINLRVLYFENPMRELNASLKHYSGQIEGGAAEFIRAVSKHVFLGFPKDVDKQVNKSLEKFGAKKAVNYILRHWGSGETNNVASTLSGGYKNVQNWAFIAGRPDMATRNIMQPFLDLGFFGPVTVGKAMLPIGKEKAAWLKEGLFYKKSKGTAFEIGSTEMGSAIGGIAKAPMTWSHQWNVWRSLKSAFIGFEELIKNPKYWKHGWAAKERMAGLTPKGKGLLENQFFPSELRNLRMATEWGIPTTTQYDYSRAGMPPIMTSATGSAILKFWSWPINYGFNFVKEMMHWMGGHPSWDKSLSLPLKMRTGALRHIAFTTLMVGVAKKAGWDLASVGLSLDLDSPTLISRETFAGGPMPTRGTHALQLMSSAHTFFTSTNPYDIKRAQNTLRYYGVPTELKAKEVFVKTPTTLAKRYAPFGTLGKITKEALEKGKPQHILFKPIRERR